MNRFVKFGAVLSLLGALAAPAVASACEVVGPGPAPVGYRYRAVGPRVGYGRFYRPHFRYERFRPYAYRSYRY